MSDNREKYDSDGVYVARNHESYEESCENAVHFYAGAHPYGSTRGRTTFSTQEARDIAAALNAAADSFEALKPDPQAEFVAKLESLGLGAVVETASYRYVKLSSGIGGRWTNKGSDYQTFASNEFSTRAKILSEGVK